MTTPVIALNLILSLLVLTIVGVGAWFAGWRGGGQVSGKGRAPWRGPRPHPA